MSQSPLASGRYFSLAPGIDPDAGGQTRATLMRNRLFAAAGADARVLTVTPHDDLDRRREILLERGMLTPEVPLLNIFEHYRERDWPEVPSPRELPDLGRFTVAEETFRDGGPWRRHYELEDGSSRWDYLRADGTTYLRVAELDWHDPRTFGRGLLRVSRDGQVVGGYRDRGQWYRRWVQELSEGERTFVVLDSRHMVPHVVPFRARHVHVIYLLHNIHVTGDRRWDRPLNESFQRMMDRADDLDALVTLTERQREDIEMARGRATNTYVVPNPVEVPEPPAHVERDPRQVTVVARLTAQKHLGEAIRAMALVTREVPDARLDVYGSGYQHESLERLVRRLGLTDRVTLRGHDPRAREHLWRSSAFLMTSRFEGYPLATLESMSHGCPVVSYDIKYGPREQITDGVDGYLVAAGDVEAMAQRVVGLLRQPELVRRMSAAALAKARQHDQDRFLADWAAVVDAAVASRPRRVALQHARLDVRRLRVGRGRRAVWSSRRRPQERLRFRGELQLDGAPDGAPSPGDLQVELAAIHATSGRRQTVPVRVRSRPGRDGGVQLAADVTLAQLLDGEDGAEPQAQEEVLEEPERPERSVDPGSADVLEGPAAVVAGDAPEAEDDEVERVRLRLFVTWRNVAWSTDLRREDGAPGGLETGYDDDDAWVLTRRAPTTR